MKNKKTPLRTCIVSKEKLEKKELLRIVKNKEGQIFVDDTLKANGRGCYIKKDEQIILEAKSKKILDHEFNTSINEKIYNELLKKI